MNSIMPGSFTGLSVEDDLEVAVMHTLHRPTAGESLEEVQDRRSRDP